jgi:uncharacterized membrane protein YeaQ/YmgE (transglycosylase-associated protein family)
MTMSVGTVAIAIDPGSILAWALIGLVAGFLASKVMLGHGLGLFADIAVGIVGAFAGGLLAGFTGVTFTVPGHPIISEMIVAFIGAMVLLLLLRLLGSSRRRSYFR